MFKWMEKEGEKGGRMKEKIDIKIKMSVIYLSYINKNLKGKNKESFKIVLIHGGFSDSIEYNFPTILFFINYSNFYFLLLTMLSHLANYPSIVLFSQFFS